MGIISNNFYSLFMYNIGDIVVVVDPGETYSSYKKIFEKLNLKNKIENPSFSKGTIAQVFAYTAHEARSDVLFAIRDNNDNECVVGQKGLRKASEVEKMLFQLGYVAPQSKQSDEIPTVKLKKFSINII